MNYANDLINLVQGVEFMLDIVYATPNNFAGQKLYPEPFCYLRKQTYQKLQKAQQKFKQHGKQLVLWDAFRPLAVQRKMWSLIPDERFVANPDNGNANHCKGNAVDVTLADLDGNLLPMPTEFDHFGPESFRANLTNCTSEIQANVKLLTDIMCSCGFQTIPTEWWHFSDVDDYPYVES